LFYLLPPLFLTAFPLAAQTAGEMDAVLESRALTYAQAARFILPAAGTAAEDVSAEAAFAAALGKGWLPQTAAAGDPARLDALALLLMKAFNLEGGLLYRVFPGPRYAYRELVYKRIIQGRFDSSMFLSGEDFFRVLGRTMDIAESAGTKNSGDREND
jgi:hypothetical protein